MRERPGKDIRSIAFVLVPLFNVKFCFFCHYLELCCLLSGYCRSYRL